MQRPAVKEEMAKRGGGGGEGEERRQRHGVMRLPRGDDGGKTVEEPVDAHRAVGAAAIVESTTITSWPRREAGEKRRQVRLTLTGGQSGSREGSATVSVPSRLARWESAHGMGKGEGQGEVAVGTKREAR